MLNKIIVTLDGSKLAEKALPYAIQLANMLKGSILLVRVAEHSSVNTDTPQNIKDVLNNIETYLNQVQETITTKYLPPEQVNTIAMYGDPLNQLASLIELEKPAMVVMTTHGRSILPRMLVGSVANRLLQQTKAPVVLIRPTNLEDTSELAVVLEEPNSLSRHADRTRLVVTLDGTPESEAALVPAEMLARETGGTIFLLQVVPPIYTSDFSGNWYVYDVEDQSEAMLKAANDYLDTVETSLIARGLNCVKVVRVGNAADEIVDYARKADASFVVMATHARRSFGQIMLGSVADEVMRRSHLPILMVHTLGKKEVLPSEAPEAVTSK